MVAAMVLGKMAPTRANLMMPLGEFNPDLPADATQQPRGGDRLKRVPDDHEHRGDQGHPREDIDGKCSDRNPRPRPKPHKQQARQRDACGWPYEGNMIAARGSNQQSYFTGNRVTDCQA